MRRVYTSPNAAQCNLLRSLLESNGIPCLVRNETLSGLWGKVPWTDVWPELWVADESQFDEARRIVEEATEHPNQTA
jgi:hypothetical protein